MIFRTEDKKLEIDIKLPPLMTLLDVKALLESEMGTGKFISAFISENALEECSDLTKTIQDVLWTDENPITVRFASAKRPAKAKPGAISLLDKLAKQRLVDQNYALAIEYAPEMLISVEMLFVRLRINDIFFIALVDSGAQATIMSARVAKEAKIEHLIDTRFKGTLSGVGTAPSRGKIHLVEVNIGASHLPCGFTIMDSLPFDALIGLDLLRRFQCSIDLSDNTLKIKATNDAIPFLRPSEIPAACKDLKLPIPGVSGQQQPASHKENNTN